MHPLVARANRNIRSAVTLNRNTEIKPLCATLQLRRADSLLDVGCGDGYWTVRFAERAGRVVALDPDDGHLAHARVHHTRPNVAYQQGVGEALPFAAESFDKVVSVSSVEHFRDPLKGFAEMYRILRPGGRMAVSVDTLIPENSSAGFRAWHSKRHFVTTYFREHDLLDSLMRIGFQVEPHATIHLFRSKLTRRAREIFIRQPRLLLPLFPIFRALVAFGESSRNDSHGQIIVITATKPTVATNPS